MQNGQQFLQVSVPGFIAAGFLLPATTNKKAYLSTNETFTGPGGKTEIQDLLFNTKFVVTKAIYNLTKPPVSFNQLFLVEQFIAQFCRVSRSNLSLHIQNAMFSGNENQHSQILKYCFPDTKAFPLFFNKSRVFFLDFVNKLSPVKSSFFKCLSSLDPSKTHG